MNQRVLLMLAAVVLARALSPAAVSAHAAYDHSIPARDEVVAQASAQVDVFFEQDVFKQQGRNFVRVFDERSAQVSTGDGVVDDNDRKHISAALPAGLANGQYIVRWMTTSDIDGDTDEGAFCFYVGVQPTASQRAACAALEPTPAATSTQTAPAQPAMTGAPTATPLSSKKSDGGTSTAAIVVGAVAAGTVIVLVAGAGAVWLRRRTRA